MIAMRLPCLTVRCSHDNGRTWDHGGMIDGSVWVMGSMCEVEPDVVLYCYWDSMASSMRMQRFKITPDAPATLHVLTHVFVEDSCFATVKWALVEYARLERNGQLVRVQSWNGGGSTILAAPLDQCAEQVTRAIERAVNGFVAYYDAVNPKP